MMPGDLHHAWLLLAGYLLGSVPFGLLIAWLRGRGDLREAGSGNIGAANVTRVVGIGAGGLTLLLDGGKGMLSVWLAARFSEDQSSWMMAAGLAAILGHLFPLWLGFRGGRGVATGAGVFLLVCPAAAAACALLWLLVVAHWRYVSLGSIAAAAALPPLVYLLWAPRHAPPAIVSLGACFAAVLIILQHRKNIQRLLSGSEPQLTLRRK
jgi:glycerol-3-phosphate acyltransferase PlsY